MTSVYYLLVQLHRWVLLFFYYHCILCYIFVIQIAILFFKHWHVPVVMENLYFFRSLKLDYVKSLN